LSLVLPLLAALAGPSLRPSLSSSPSLSEEPPLARYLLSYPRGRDPHRRNRLWLDRPWPLLFYLIQGEEIPIEGTVVGWTFLNVGKSLSGSPSEELNFALSVSITLRPQPFLATCSLDSDCLGTTDCLGNHWKVLVGRSSPISKANKINMSGNGGRDWRWWDRRRKPTTPLAPNRDRLWKIVTLSPPKRIPIGGTVFWPFGTVYRWIVLVNRMETDSIRSFFRITRQRQPRNYQLKRTRNLACDNHLLFLIFHHLVNLIATTSYQQLNELEAYIASIQDFFS
jgi:hypothetical protein